MPKKITITVILVITIISLSAITGYILLNPRGEVETPPLRFEPTLQLLRPLTEPGKVVQKFIEADLAGGRLGGEFKSIFESIRKYCTDDFLGMPGELLMVVDRYEILDEYPSEKQDQYFVKVRYYCKMGVASAYTGFKDEQLIKEYDNGAVITSFDCSHFAFPSTKEREYETKTDSELVTFQLIKKEGKWQINSPWIEPRISSATLQTLLTRLR